MGKQPNIKLNFLYNISYQILLVIAPLIVAPYVSRVLGDGNIGMYSYTYSMAQYFSAFCALGVNNHGNRTVAVCRDDPQKLSSTFSEITTLKGCISIVVLTAYCLYAGFIADESYRIYSFLQLFYILSIVLDLHWFFAGLEEFKITVMRLLIIKVLSTGCIFLFVKRESDLLLYTLIMSVSFLISEIYLWFVARKRVKWTMPKWKDMRKHLKPMLILFIPILAVDLYRMMDKIMLGEMISMNSVGQYENAEKIIKICLSVVTALSAVMLPRMAKLNAENDVKTMRKYHGNSMKVILALACALAGGILAVGRPFAPIFFGEQFVECGYVLEILAISVLLIAWSNMVRTQYLIPCHRDRVYIVAVWCGVAVNLALNFILIPKYSAVGAAIATVITEFVVCIVQTIYAWKALPMDVFFRNLVAYGVIGAAMFGAVKGIAWILPWSGVMLLVAQVAAGAVIYLSLTLIYLWFTDREVLRSAMKFVRRVLKKLHLAN